MHPQRYLHVDGLDLLLTVKFSPLGPDCREEYNFVYTMDSQGVKFPKEFSIAQAGNCGGFNDKNLGVTVTDAGNGVRIARIPMDKLDFAGEIFIGFCRSWYDENGKHCFDFSAGGEHILDHRLNFGGYFSADKMEKLIIR